MKSLLAAVKKGKVLVSDGAWGTQLHQCGLTSGECPELWNVTRRADVFSVAKGYIDAGADMIETNSFGGSPLKLGRYGLGDRAAELNEAAAAISREAAGVDRFVLGSIGPTGAILMTGEVTEEELREGFRIQAEALQKGGADVVCIETMSALDEACIAVRAAREAAGGEIVCTFTFEKTATGEYRTMMGISPAEMVQAVKEAGADIIGTNCGNGFDGMVEVVREIKKVDRLTPVLVHANAGKPVLRNGVTVFPETPEMMASKVNDLIGAGADIIGGCCGTGPEHIRALAEAIRYR
ncbi:MAG: homocysteine S-methyltransferase family protein [Chitinispirillaceae bacterium]|nr:homocysteine S-methyltransferase family protein [Chitinispirillaceae bacterium]